MHAVRDAASIWDSGWVGVLPTFATADDVCHWPYSVGILVSMIAFQALCIGQCVEFLILYELWWRSLFCRRLLFLAVNGLGAQF